ncbi:MAG: YggS family pyridoxal phosphate-dependent enzyme [Acidobacteriota bacterium]
MNSPQPEGFERRLQRVRDRIASAIARAKRRSEEITLVAVSKTHPPEMVRAALTAGLTDFGENRVQEAEDKLPQVGRGKARWHLIGHLQSNKARRAVELFDVIHSLDSAALAKRLDRFCLELDRKELPVLIQVDLAQEATKSGATEAQLPEILEVIKGARALRLTGLMVLPPFFEDAEKVRPFFSRLRELRDDLRSQGAFGESPGELSMGMTHDFEIAIEEGATMLRIGTAIFGERK